MVLSTMSHGCSHCMCIYFCRHLTSRLPRKTCICFICIWITTALCLFLFTTVYSNSNVALGTSHLGCVSLRSSCPKFAATLHELLSGCAWQSAVSSCKQTWRMSLLIWTLSGSANFWSPGTVMENTWKKVRGSGDHGGGMSWGHNPPTFWQCGSPRKWRSICK